MRFEEFEICLKWWKQREENDRAWKVKVQDVLEYDSEGVLTSANLDIKNPKSQEDFEHMPPEQLATDILAKEREIAELVEDIQRSISSRSI